MHKLDVECVEKRDLLIHALPAGKTKKNENQIGIISSPLNKSRVLNFRSYRMERSGFEVPEYNLYEISAAEDADGIIRQAIKKKRALLSKEGYRLTGKNNNTLEYMEMRFKQIALAQGMPMELLFKNVGGDLVRFHNAFLKKSRNPKASGGRKRKTRSTANARLLNPISAYFRLPAETMRVKTNDYGKPVKYMQIMPDGRYEEYNAEDIIHLVFNKRAGFNFAAPGLNPAIDDVKALRRIEENVELLIEQHLFPLFTLSIGTDEWPSSVDDTTGISEVEVWQGKLDELPPSGGIVVSHRHKFDLLGNDKVIPVDKYLDHFKRRAYTSAGVSNLDMGEGDGMNRSTADNASKMMINDVKDYQSELAMQIEFEIIYELLLEKYDVSVLEESNIVHFEWNEIDTESMLKVENHNALMYSMHAITEDELRLRNKQKIIDTDEERSKMFLYRYEAPKIEMETESAKAINASKPATSTSSSSSSKSSKAKNTAKSRQQPSNQHGKKLGPSNRQSSLEKNKIFNFIGDFNTNDHDYDKLRLLNLIISLDLSGKSQDFYDTIYDNISHYYDLAIELIDEDNIPIDIAKDILAQQLYNLTQEN